MTEIERLRNDDDVVCLEAYGTEYIAVIWIDPAHGPIANLRFGSGRHQTLLNPDLEKVVGRDSVEHVNVVSLEEADLDG